MNKLIFVGSGALLGFIAGWVAGSHAPLLARVYATTPFGIQDSGDSIHMNGVMKAVGTTKISYPGNGFRADCTKDLCRTFVAVARNDSGTMLLTDEGVGAVREYSADRVVFEEDGGVLTVVAGDHLRFTYTLDREAKTLRAVSDDAGSNVILELGNMEPNGFR